MEMTTTQRLILANQYKLMGLLEPENAAKYQRLEMIVKSGFALELNALDSEFSDVSVAECQLVLDVLEMYHALQISAEQLKNGDFSTHRLQFSGFCAVKEKKFVNYARFLIENEGKYQNVTRSSDWDAQVPMCEKYRQMLNEWRQCPRQFHLSAAEIQNILNA